MLRSICMQHQRLVDKFRSAKLSAPHLEQASAYCERYFTLLGRISSWDIPEGQTIPADVIPELPSSSMQSQVCWFQI
ncbi:unnamed protein product [Gongylonema pulchrum]|uniref:KNOX2 domain-containing protein n=1 Tax=Gongylonema pulchrum TaxID=637853 RepID=A0A183DIU0_9BILA|nr:unnamed protein product [Gongylonema pulchrum]